MIQLRIHAFFAVLLLAGCATAPSGPTAAIKPDAAKPVSAAPETLPSNELTTPLLYDLLSAEVAAQRGQLVLAAGNYLRVATTTRDPRVAKRAVRLALAARDQDLSLNASKLWVKLEPASLEAHQVTAALQIRGGHTDDALPHLAALLQGSNEETGQGFDAVVTLLGREADKKLALDVFERLAQPHAGDPNARFAHAQLAFLVGKSEVAAADVDVLLKARPNWSKALVLKATIERHQGKPDAALRSFKQAVDATPGDAGLRLSYARLLVDEQRYDQARAEFEALQRQLPDNTDITYALGLLALQLADLDRAEKSFRQLYDAGQRMPEAAYALGQIAEQRQKWDEALRWYEGVDDGNSMLDARVRSAVILKNRDGLAAARAYLQGLRADAAPEEQARLALAEAELLREGDQLPEALAVLDAAIEAAPDSADLLYSRAMVAEQLDRLDLLERDLRRILVTDPDNAQALNALGYTLADRTSRHQEAYDFIHRALEQRPEDPAINDSMGWVLFRLGRYPEAEGYLIKAATLMKDPEVAAHLGELYWAMGRKEEARRVWDQALKEAPDSPLLKTVIQRLTQ